MRVVRATRFGVPEALEPGEGPDPQPGPSEIIVDVAVAEMLFLDTQLRAGWGRGAADAHAAIEARTAAGRTLLVTGREAA